ncbi:MAG: nicotinate-nucleotide adenylyltransferase [Planctomycetia bacterium]|nr:nicotinate-nucleotide adenylyltransferase [Planctomycetia bacterium]
MTTAAGSTRRRIGIYGGSFDPIHLGHLLLAETCREVCALDEVWFLPCANPPHKPVGSLSAGQLRVEMIELAIAGNPWFKVCRIELDRSGPSFTVETLRQLTLQHPTAEFCFLMGADSLADLPQWREPRTILELAEVIAVNRGHQTPLSVDLLENQLGSLARDRVSLVAMPAIDVSATDLRERVRSNRSTRFRIPRAVEVYITQHGLYRE